jgi:hypothetical protein
VRRIASRGQSTTFESDSAILSWSAQERAETFYNTRGLAATLDEATRLERIIRERHDAVRLAKAPERHERRKAAGLASDPGRPRRAWDCDDLRDASGKRYRLSLLPYRETPDGSPVADVIGYEGPRSGTWDEYLRTEDEARERLALLLDHYAIEIAHVYDTGCGLVVAEWTHADEG